MIYQSSLWISDLDEVLASLPALSSLEGKSVMITGAAGLVLSAVTDLLIRYNETHEKKIGILAAGRWPEEMTGRFGDYTEKPYFTFVRYDASRTDNSITLPCDYIIHGASNAFPEMIVKEPVETMLSNVLGVKYLLDYARECGAKRLLYISSSEVYGQKQSAEPYREGEYGYIDLLSPRNSYSVGKRAAETLCASYAAEYGVESVIVRPGHIYGPTAAPQDNRVASAWSWAAAKGEPIIMKSDGAQKRSYCYCLDCASAILKVLLEGENTRAYNISNPASIVTIREMAALVAKAGNVPLSQAEATEAEKKGFNPMSNSSLDSAGLESLGWRGLFDAPRGFAHTVQILREAFLS
ncbi:MAG: NAD-dependent epimerase/dehydratase family protein [Clostridia bacterium]|nr:NAD-dependent epimerase/dehydratase family protein [Clostridia bacterium]